VRGACDRLVGFCSASEESLIFFEVLPNDAINPVAGVGQEVVFYCVPPF
jgi:hypothetical protein